MTDLLPLLEELYREKVTMLLRHQAAALRITQYDVNNTYQYIIAREDVQLSWLAKAIEELGVSPVSPVSPGSPGSNVQQTETARVVVGKGRRPPPVACWKRMPGTRRPSSIAGALASNR